MPNVPSNILVLDNLGHGIDWNDGLDGRAGTPSLAAQKKVHAANGATTIEDIPVESLEDSPVIERAEQCTVGHHYRLSYEEAINRLTIYGRGALTQDSGGNFYRVLSSTVQRQKMNKALLGVQSESLSFDVPPDEFSLRPVKLSVDIMKHPRYFFALMPTNQIPNFVGNSDTNDQINVKQAIIRSIQAYRENPFIPTASNLNNIVGFLHEQIIAGHVSGKFVVSKVNPNYNPLFKSTLPVDVGTSAGLPPVAATTNGAPNPTIYFYAVNTNSSDPNGKMALAMAAAREIIGKLWRCEDTPLINGLELEWSEYYFRPPFINLGGYIEDPTLATPGLPDYFYSTAYPPDPSLTIFDGLSYFNPQCFSSTGIAGGPVLISWLRDADQIDNQRTFFKITRRWLGGTIGAWDADLYTQNNRPAVVSDYRNLILN